MKINQRIAALRNEMHNHNISAYILLTNDPHLSEEIDNYWKTREYFSGFTGSAGSFVITNNKMGLWTDSRYFIQAENQIHNTGIKLFKKGIEGTPSIIDFLSSTLIENSTIGIDTLCCSKVEFDELQNGLSKFNLKIIDIDLVSGTWLNRPEITNNKIFEHPIELSGESTENKLKRVKNFMNKHKADYHLISSLDDIAWLFNLRGNDIPYNPVFFSYALISQNETVLFTNKNKISSYLKKKLFDNNITIKSYKDVFKVLKLLDTNQSILIDRQRTNQKIFKSLKSRKIVFNQNPSQLMKSMKNEKEIEVIRKAMINDGIAMVKFWIWLEENVGKEVITEIDIADKLFEYRSQHSSFKSISFGTIAGYNANGAIVHYKATKNYAAKIDKNGFLLVDSGGQYLEGTTDITRTFSLSKLSEKQKKDYTLVLKGLINLTLVKFPKGTRGCNIDILARKYLWDVGLNYGHGTGHGVGSFLNVHEGPQSIRQELNEQILLPGMITSNEPGLYRENEYGIRLENIILCKEEIETEFGEFLSFDTLTLCPFDLKAIDFKLLKKYERQWLNDYHKIVYNKLASYLSPKQQMWLNEKCKKI